MTPFPWGNVMQFGLGVLKLAPADFWAMTPREIAAAMGAGLRHMGALARPEFTQLMERFPDE